MLPREHLRPQKWNTKSLNKTPLIATDLTAQQQAAEVAALFKIGANSHFVAD